MTNEESTPRVIHPMVTFWEPDQGDAFRDYAVRPEKVDDTNEVVEVEEVLAPVPKAESAQESVSSKESIVQTEHVASETAVQTEYELPTQTVKTDSLDADKENGKLSESSEDEPRTLIQTPPSPVTSLPNSSSATNPGSVTPPVPGKPLT